MKDKTLGVLIAVTVLALAAALVAYSMRAGPGPADGGPELLFPELGDRVNDVSALAVREGGATFRIVRVGDQWGLEDKGGYPVDFAKVKEAWDDLTETD